MMINTNGMKKEFGNRAHAQLTVEYSQSTQVGISRRGETIKIIQKRTDESTFSGYRKVNFADQKVKEAYRKFNKMLGGS